MLKPTEDYSDYIQRLFPSRDEFGDLKKIKTFTFQVTNDCSLCCTYCYELNKSKDYLSFETGKRVIDYIFEQAKLPDTILSYEKNEGIIIDFIGGEPFLNIEVILQIINYFETRLIEEDSPWLFFHRYSFSSNGVAYRNSKVQEMIKIYGDLLSIGITVDGYKELHDKCRIFPNGAGSYELAVDAAIDLKNKTGSDSTKITLCPENIDKFFGAVTNMLSLGFVHINANCVFEEGWELKDAKILYQQMKKVSDYLFENDLEDKCYISMFNKDNFCPLEDTEDNNKNWCGGTGEMIAVDYKGDFFPCLRYMETSLPKDRKPLIVGNLDCGIYTREEDKKTLEFLESITRKSQSPDKCLVCPIAKGCAWCSGYNYSRFGTPNKRATFICIMHKATGLGNWYFWAKEAEKKKIKCEFINYLPKEEAIEIMGENDFKMLSKVR